MIMQNTARVMAVFGTITLSIAVAAIAGGTGDERISTIPYFTADNLTPVWMTEDEGQNDSIAAIGHVTLLDQNGEMFAEGDMSGKISVANFFLIQCPSLCPRLSSGMKRIQDSVAGNATVQLLSISVTPEVDTVKALAQYADAFGAKEGTWFFLTGKKNGIYTLARESFRADLDSNDTFLHTESFYLIDGERRIRGIYNGTLPSDLVRLIEDLRVLEAEGKEKG